MRTFISLFFLSAPLWGWGQARVGQATIVFTDELRHRKLITELWYATEEIPGETDDSRAVYVLPPTVRNAAPLPAKRPLVLLSHGTGGGRHGHAWLATALAAEGYLVAAVDHWGNTWDNKIPENFAKFWDRPQDLSFILTGILQHATWGPLVDAKRVAAVGFSLGGYTVISIAGARLDYDKIRKFVYTEQGEKEANIPELPGFLEYIRKNDFSSDYSKVKDKLYDDRIKCIVAMAPGVGQGFTPETLRRIKIPSLVIGAAADSIAPVATNAGYVARHIPGAKVRILPAPAGHYLFLNECTGFGMEVIPAMICQDAAGVDRGQLHAEITKEVLLFLKNNLP